jgi:hypothetical protein
MALRRWSQFPRQVARHFRVNEQRTIIEANAKLLVSGGSPGNRTLNLRIKSPFPRCFRCLSTLCEMGKGLHLVAQFLRRCSRAASSRIGCGAFVRTRPPTAFAWAGPSNTARVRSRSRSMSIAAWSGGTKTLNVQVLTAGDAMPTVVHSEDIRVPPTRSPVPVVHLRSRCQRTVPGSPGASRIPRRRRTKELIPRGASVGNVIAYASPFFLEP